MPFRSVNFNRLAVHVWLVHVVSDHGIFSDNSNIKRKKEKKKRKEYPHYKGKKKGRMKEGTFRKEGRAN